MFKRFLFWIWLQTITVKKYKEYLKKNDIKEEELCYRVDTDNCDASCQGACECPLAQFRKVSKRKMMIYKIKLIENRKDWDRFFKELENDQEFQEK